MASITVKKADNSTDVTYVSMVASAGDKSEALWRQTALGGSANLQPYLRVRSQFNGTRSVRRVEGTFGYQNTYVDTNTSQTVVKATALGSFVFQVPVVTDTVAADEAAAQFGNLLASTLMKSVNSSGFAPT
jgi:hypothetical protein